MKTSSHSRAPKPQAHQTKVAAPAPVALSMATARVAAVILLLLFAGQAFYAAREDSVTIDEFIHLPMGLYMLRTRDFAPDPINPPLTRMIAAVPLLFSEVKFDPPADAGIWGMAYLFLHDNTVAYQDLYVRARAMIILLGCALGALVFVWASQLYGPSAGVAALFLFTFCPETLAHGHFVTLDMAGALGFTATAYTVWRLLKQPSHVNAAISGGALGIAILLKLSAVPMVAAAGTAVAVAVFQESSRKSSRLAGRLVAQYALIAVAVAILVINLGYGFQGTFASLDRATLRPGGTLASLRSALPWLRLPLPLPFLNGVDEVMTTGVVNDPRYFLAGELSARGWWYYHLVAFFLKTPLPLLGGCLLAFGMWVMGRDRGERSYCLFIPVVYIFLFNSLFNSLYIGVRHVLPAYPLLFVAMSPLLVRPLAALGQGARTQRAWIEGGVVAIALLWLVAGTLLVTPRYLQYFNELAGGPEGGHRYLVDSNMDWGQDLIRLKRYMDEKGLPAVHLAYFGRVDPRAYGISFQPLQRQEAHGPVVISASYLMGRPYYWFVHGDQIEWVPAGTYTWLQQYKPWPGSDRYSFSICRDVCGVGATSRGTVARALRPRVSA